MKVKNLLTALLLGLCLTSMLVVSSCCVSKAFEDDDEPYIDDLNLPPAQ